MSKSETLVSCPKCGTSNFTPQGLKSHVCDGRNRSLALTPEKAIELEVVEPTPLLHGKSVNQVYTFSGPEEIEQDIRVALADEEAHRRASAVADLRSGVLFFLYKASMGVNGRKYTGFWEACEAKFGVSRMTISKKMRLAVTWAKENGASEEVIHQLAAASALDPQNSAVALALNWIGDRTTTDLYRDYGLITYGPKGGDLSEHRTGKRRTKAEKQFDDAAAECADWYRYGFLGIRDTYLHPEKSYKHLEPRCLANLADVVDRLNKELKSICRSRKIRPAKHATWMADHEAELAELEGGK